MTAPEELLRFWLDEVGPAKWYIHDPALDSAICEEFMGVWEQAMEGKFSLWLTYPSGALASEASAIAHQHGKSSSHVPIGRSKRDSRING